MISSSSPDQLGSQTTKLNPFIQIHKNLEGRQAELVRREQDTSSPTQIFTFLKLETFPFHLQPVVAGTGTVAQWHTTVYLSRSAGMPRVLIGCFISFLANIERTEVRWEAQCQVENRNNLSRIMSRYLTPSYGLGMTILQISWVGFILTF